MEVKRLYPIRFTKKSWEIPLYSKHIVDDSENSKKNKIKKTLIDIANFDENEPVCFDNNKLCRADDTVIPNNEFNMEIKFPLSSIVNCTVKTDEENFSLSNVLESIKRIYQTIYETEEQTSPETTYLFDKICNYCSDINIDDIINAGTNKLIEECSICLEKKLYDDKMTVKLCCGHHFHLKCVKKWFMTKKTCPLCRKNIINCKKCFGEGKIECEYTGVVIPAEERAGIGRNPTFGVFGIWGYDLDKLFLKKLWYNNVTRTLKLEVVTQDI